MAETRRAKKKAKENAPAHHIQAQTTANGCRSSRVQIKYKKYPLPKQSIRNDTNRKKYSLTAYYKVNLRSKIRNRQLLRNIVKSGPIDSASRYGRRKIMLIGLTLRY
ncbi:MAG: hypothetical protein HOM52_01225 [Rhodospirillaceae bacterium]|nr:hypothetical protein [Rhodospirillaceae bacterium]MBT3928994.1 hypothetical protein [Rhodospirillaceae bacterium]MBT4425706.1 hypothetical protein [Rhodospirillaceae bacterium]MBT5037104.1 hypothetical protein [Rhodospirillaceae bacterium]MBT6831318.1 hypothetical protein [Rhodospirillaceae bacterium]